MNLDEQSKEILLSLRSEGINPANNMEPDNPLIPYYNELQKKGLILTERTEEGGIAWVKLTTMGKRVQSELV